MDFSAPLNVSTTAIPGLLIVSLSVHGDNRGWFKENWQRQKMVEAGLPDFEPVQNNVSYNDKAGTTRGIHAEPWDKFVSVATGRVFGAWVDLRDGDSLGKVVTLEIDPSVAVFVPRGVGNGYQTLEDNTAYSYLVNAHWSSESTYTFLNLADKTANFDWPIPLAQAELSDKDREHPMMSDVVPVPNRSTVILGSNGQLGKVLAKQFPAAHNLSRADLDVTSIDERSLDWQSVGIVINATAFTSVDRAETSEGRRVAWATNVNALSSLVEICRRHQITLVHVSSDYVFDGEFDGEASESHPFAPLNVYGVTKAAGDALVAGLSRHYIVRTSWVIGDGENFVVTMKRLAGGEISADVINDQIGRLSFATEIARGIDHLLNSDAQFGVYNLTASGTESTWFDIAREVFRLCGSDPERVRPISAVQYAANQAARGVKVADRPRNSMLNLHAIHATGFTPRDWRIELAAYLARIKADGA